MATRQRARAKPGIEAEPADAPPKAVDITIDSIDAKTLVGDVRDFILQEARSSKKLPWDQRGEKDQREFIERTAAMARDLVRRVVEQVATGGRESIHVTSGGYTVKDDMKLTLRCPNVRRNSQLMVDAPEHALFLVFVPHASFDAERAPAKAQADQGSLEYGGEDPGADRPLFDRTNAGAETADA